MLDSLHLRAADRFAQARVRRCPIPALADTEEGKQADATRGFLKDQPPLVELDALPDEFK